MGGGPQSFVDGSAVLDESQPAILLRHYDQFVGEQQVFKLSQLHDSILQHVRQQMRNARNTNDFFL
jgi:hypothetical protein